MQTNKEKNTAALLAYYAEERKRAEAEPNATIREISIKSARNSEWHTLFSCLLVPHLREIHDGGPIAERLDEMRAEIARAE